MPPWSLLTYSTDEFAFPSLVRQTLGLCDLSRVAGNDELRTWQTDQTGRWHDAFYAGFARWRDAYDRFVHDVIAPQLGEPFYYQNVPTFRVHLPNNLAVGEFHTDAVYHHPIGEETFWVPLTDAYDTCSLWIADDDDELHCVNARPGDVVHFRADLRRHGNKINTTGRSRVSFDFRCLPTRLLPTVEGPPTKHTRLRFVPGEYYALDAVVS